MKKNIKKIGVYSVLIVFGLVCLVPIFLVTINSFKTHNSIIENPLKIGFDARFSNYINEWRAGNFHRAFINSLIFVGSSIIVVLSLASCAAYALSKKRKGNAILMMYFLMTMTVPLQLFMSPLYFIYAKLNWLGNVIAVSLILAACNLPFCITLLRTFFLTIPKEIEEAALIDGASTKEIVLRIMFPLVRPGFLTAGIIVGLNAWNDFLISSTFLIGEKNFTASLVLVSLNGPFSNDIGMNMAGAILLIVPILLAFLIAQKYFMDGLVAGAVKG